MIKSTLLLGLLVFLPATATASNWDLQRLADQLVYASNDLARGAKAVRGFSSVGHNANRLRTKAQQLADSISRGRTSAHIRTRFSDVSRYYLRVESSFLSARRTYRTPYVDDKFDNVASLYDSLSYEFHGGSYYGSFRSSPQPYQRNYYSRAPFYTTQILINPPRNYGQRNPRPPVTKRNNRQRDDYDHQSPVINRQNQRDRLGNISNNRINNRDNRRRDDNARDSRRDRSGVQRQSGRDNDRISNNNRSDQDRSNSAPDQLRDNPVMQRQNQRNSDRAGNDNQNDLGRINSISDQSRNRSVTPRQNRQSSNGFGRVGLNNLRNSSNATAIPRNNRPTTNNRSVRQRR